MQHFWRSGYGDRFPLYDGVGTARHLVDASANITDSYKLAAFGEPVTTSGSTPNPYRFGGAWGYTTDPSGMLQLGARFYWPEIGRFVQRDPIGSSMNRYVYALDNPVYWIDPEGLWALGGELFAGIGAGFYFGVDPCTGFFVKAKAGVGFGFGGGWLPSFDPSELSPGSQAGFTQPGEGSSFGFDVGASASAFGRGGAAGIAGGWASDPQGNLGRYPRKPQYPLLGGRLPAYAGKKYGGTWGVNVGVTAVLEGGFY